MTFIFDFIEDGSPFDYLKDDSYFPLSHIVTPYIFHFFIGNAWISIAMIGLFETLEATVFAIVGSYLIFQGVIEARETIFDSLVGDVFNGLIGVALAALLRYIVRAPDFYKYYKTFRTSWRKYTAFVVAMTLSSTQLDVKIGPPMLEFNRYGVHFGFFLYAVVSLTLVIIAYWSLQTPDKEFAKIWEGYTAEGYRLVWGSFFFSLVIFFAFFVYTWNSPYFIGFVASVVIALFYLLFYLYSREWIEKLVLKRGKFQ